MEKSERIALLEANLGRQLQWISWSDTKSAFIFTLVAAMVGVLATVAPDRADQWSILQAVSASFALAASAAAFVFLSLAAFPRITGPKGSLVYCGGVAQREIEQFCSEISSIEEEVYAHDLASQCHRKAVIACEKFAWVRRAMIARYLAIGPWSVALWLLYSAGEP
jgi:hypothetical protein